MNCPRCSAYNPNDAVKCRSCGAPMRSQGGQRPPQQRRSGSPPRPSEDEQKYVIVGAVTVIAFIAVIILIISSIACNCGGCGKKPNQDFTGDIVGGDYEDTEGGDNLSSADTIVSGDDVPVE